MTEATGKAWAAIILAFVTGVSGLVTAWRAAPGGTARAADACAVEMEASVERERVTRGYVQALAVRLAVLEQARAGTSWPVGVPEALAPPASVALPRAGDAP